MTTLNKNTIIYCLTDDYDNIKYIGKSHDPKNRLKEHINEIIHKRNAIK